MTLKYTCSILINLPINQVVDLWNNENHFKEWQYGFIAIEHLSGTPHTPGAKSRIRLKGPKGEMELIETIQSIDLPLKKTALYEHKHMTNTQVTKFKRLSANQTEYTTEVEYLQFNGVLIKIFARLFPNKFKAQSQKWMDQFKSFAED